MEKIIHFAVNRYSASATVVINAKNIIFNNLVMRPCNKFDMPGHKTMHLQAKVYRRNASF